jgi:hypothetical protein
MHTPERQGNNCLYRHTWQKVNGCLGYEEVGTTVACILHRQAARQAKNLKRKATYTRITNAHNRGVSEYFGVTYTLSRVDFNYILTEV